MTSRVSLPDSCSSIVFDASVLINLNASGCGMEILSALPYECVTPLQVIDELTQGAHLGHSDIHEVEHLIDSGELVSKPFGPSAEGMFESLISGDALATLDDGEAATIALAMEQKAAAIIDERKALNLCHRHFPDLSVATTPDLLLHDCIKRAIGPIALADATYNALKVGRMRVPTRLHSSIIELIGVERATECPSLPKRIRTDQNS